MSGNSDIKLSFCCLAYNHAKYVEKCIESIWNQDYKNIEILVLNDGSTDNTADVLDKIQKESPVKMRVFNQENCGVIGKNFNKLINEAKGEYIALIACDDKFIENTIKEKMDLLLSDEKLAFICHSKVCGIDDNDNIIDTIPPLKLDEIENPTLEDILKLDFEEINSYYIQGGIYKKSVVLDFGGFDEDMICDDIIFRTKLSRYLLRRPEYKFKVLKNAGVCYRRHNSNVSSNLIRQTKGVAQYYDRYWKGETPPVAFEKWVECVFRNTNDFSSLYNDIIKYQSVQKLIKDIKIDMSLFKEGVYEKKRGIPHIFEILTYNRDNYRRKIIKILNIPILKYKKK